jgi:hypothetical protein
MTSPYGKRQSEEFSAKLQPTKKMTEKGLFAKDLQAGNPNIVGEYMYVEMAHYTDDDTVVLICVTNIKNFEVTEYKLEKEKDKNWKFIIQRFCSGNSSDQILNNVETLFASLEFLTLVQDIYLMIITNQLDKKSVDDLKDDEVLSENKK